MTQEHFFTHLIPQSSYQSVLDAVEPTEQPQLERELKHLLLLSVSQVLLAELPETARDEFVKRLISSDQQLMDWLTTTLPGARTLIIQTLDRTLLAAVSAVH